jgi:acetyl-CoA carboxylase biotin carboxyl carrier protein
MSKISSASAKPASAAAASPKLDARLVREIATMLSESDLTEIEVEKGDLRIRVARQTTIVTSAPAQTYAPAPAAVAIAATHASLPEALVVDEHNAADILKSPMVGTVYLRPSPDAKAFIEIGAHVSSGQKVLLIEAMKTFNDIVAHKSGAVTAILVEDGQPVEYGQPLFVIV